MKKIYGAWALLFAACVALGLADEPGVVVAAARQCLGILFFLPPAWLLWKGQGAGRVLYISVCSLGLTLVFLILSILLAAGSRSLGDFLHGVLAVVSAPMFCWKWWVGSLFCWAYLAITAWKQKKKA